MQKIEGREGQVEYVQARLELARETSRGSSCWRTIAATASMKAREVDMLLNRVIAMAPDRAGRARGSVTAHRSRLDTRDEQMRRKDSSSTKVAGSRRSNTWRYDV